METKAQTDDRMPVAVGLTEYQKKRKFKKTPEPKGKISKRKGEPVFVVHEHWARTLHYDFRLQMKGVLKSWAVPKGPPEKVGEKRLAIQVEPHPLEYASFEGCFEFYTKVLTEKGVQNVGNIVNEKRKIRILSYNCKKQCLEWKPIISWFKNGRTKEFLRIRVPGQQGGRRVITATPNHRIYTPGGIKLAAKLKVGESIYVPGKIWSEEQKQILLGTLLGDAHLELSQETLVPCYQLTHSGKQKNYLKFVRDQLAPEAKIRKREQSDSYRFRFTHASLINLYHQFYEKKKKIFKKEILLRLDERGLAIWYMDDGYLSAGKYVEFCTQCLGRKDNRLIANFLNEKWELGAKVYYRPPRAKSGGGYSIHLSRLGSMRFLTLINNYLLPELRYKTYLKSYRCDWKFKKGKEGIIPARIIQISKASRKDIRSQQKYDIQVRDNQNYFAGAMLVSNSIPEGQYGAGKVEIWDKGEVNFKRQEKDLIEFELFGKKLKGRFTLLHPKSFEAKNWLLVKNS